MKKNGKTLGISLIALLTIACIVLVIMIFASGEKEAYYGIMKDNQTVEKMISEKDNHIEKNVKVDSDDQFKPKKGDFVVLVKKVGTDEFSKKKVVEHDDIPHGLMMKIHDMHH